jgi:Bacterial conjugation TrbI-like protein
MTPKAANRQDEAGRETRPQEESATTQQIASEPREMAEAESQDEENKGLLQSFRAAYARARDGRSGGVGVSGRQDRSAKATDRSKGLMLLLISAVVVLLALVGMFSHSSTKHKETRRSGPSLGRPELSNSTAQESRGSVTPLQSADLSGQNTNTDQLSAEDIKNTARLRLRPGQEPKQGPALATIPTTDPALEDYRRSREASMPPPPPKVPVMAAAARNESDGLKKASLVFVRNDVNGTAAPARSSALTEPSFLARGTNRLLPNGSRLMARFQTAVSTAVKAPVVAAVEYNYERDGEIIIPAGTKAFGELQQANRSGVVTVRFHTLEMQDGTTEQINGTAMDLSYGPLKGSVSGSNAAKRILVRSLTGIGSMAAFLVGGPGGLSGASGPLDNSILLRERIASNAGLAGDQELTSMSLNENVVITVPANTRFFIVLQDSTGDRPAPRAARAQEFQDASTTNSVLPTAQELRELIELKSELNQMNRDMAATGASAQTTASPQ